MAYTRKYTKKRSKRGGSMKALANAGTMAAKGAFLAGKLGAKGAFIGAKLIAKGLVEVARQLRSSLSYKTRVTLLDHRGSVVSQEYVSHYFKSGDIVQFKLYNQDDTNCEDLLKGAAHPKCGDEYNSKYKFARLHLKQTYTDGNTNNYLWELLDLNYGHPLATFNVYMLTGNPHRHISPTYTLRKPVQKK